VRDVRVVSPSVSCKSSLDHWSEVALSVDDHLAKSVTFALGLKSV
jgi:hypothetical protein